MKRAERRLLTEAEYHIASRFIGKCRQQMVVNRSGKSWTSKLNDEFVMGSEHPGMVWIKGGRTRDVRWRIELRYGRLQDRIRTVKAYSEDEFARAMVLMSLV